MQPQKTLVLVAALALAACLVFYLPTRRNTETIVGVTYADAMNDSSDVIRQNLAEIRQRGFSLARTYFSLDWQEEAAKLEAAEAFLTEAKALGLQTYVMVTIPVGMLEFSVLQYEPILARFAGNFSGKIDYWQILNEVDQMKKSDGNSYTASEIVSIVNRLNTVIRQSNPSAKTVVTLTQLYAGRPDLLIKLRELNVDFVGLDVYEQGSGYTPNQLSELRLASGKPVLISETGCSDPDPSKREQFARSQVSAFSSQGVPLVVLFDWSDSIYQLKTTGLTF